MYVYPTHPAGKQSFGTCSYHTIKPREKSRNPLELRSYTSLGVTSTSWGTSREPRVSYGFLFLFVLFCFVLSLIYDPNVRVFTNILPTRVHADETRRRPRRVVTGARASSSWRPDSAREEARDGARRRGGSLARCDGRRTNGCTRWNDGATSERARTRGSDFRSVLET